LGAQPAFVSEPDAGVMSAAGETAQHVTCHGAPAARVAFLEVARGERGPHASIAHCRLSKISARTYSAIN